MKPLIAIYITFLLTASAFAQADILSVRVTFQYDDVRLKEALADISQRYQVLFSYSSDHINVRQRVTARASNLPLSVGLDRLFENTSIFYMPVGSHIVLKNDPNKLLSKTETEKQNRKKKQSPEPEDEQPVVLVKNEELPEVEEPKPDSILTLQMPEAPPIRQEGRMHPFDETLLNFEKWRYQTDWAIRTSPYKRIAQVSVIPFVGTNTGDSDAVTNNISMNLLWGVNGGVDGLEVGGGLNTVKNDVKGFQAALIGNQVGRDVTGTQVGGLFNYNGGTTRGLQAAGVINFAQRAEAAQTAGLINWVKEDVSGVQASGLFNLSGGNARAVQASGLFNASGGDSKVQTAGAFNLSRGNAKVQVSGVFNVAKDVEIGQFGGVVNVAKGEVKGFQIGFLNISDTVSGVPIGLINIVKRGYNKFEIYGSEILHGNFQLKLGANAFYNIFHVGARVPEGNGNYLWGFGYGIGTVSILSPKNHLNFELMAIHINENEPWTNTLNSIGQFRFLWNHQIGKSVGFFFGPTANVMVSMLRNPETGEIRSPVVPYTLVDEDLSKNTNLKGWVGVNAGFRF